MYLITVSKYAPIEEHRTQSKSRENMIKELSVIIETAGKPLDRRVKYDKNVFWEGVNRVLKDVNQ